MAGFTYMLGVDLGAAYTGTNIEVRLRDASDAAVPFSDDALTKQDGEAGVTITERSGGRFSIYCTVWPTTLPYAVLIYDAGTGNPIPSAVVEFNRQDFADVSAGVGAVTYTYTVTDSTTDLPIASVDVWATTDAPGLNVAARGTTNAFGQVVFYLDAGTYYFWRQLSGYDFSNPDTEIVG